MVVFAGIKYLEKHLKTLKIAKFRQIVLGLANQLNYFLHHHPRQGQTPMLQCQLLVFRTLTRLTHIREQVHPRHHFSA